MHTNNIIKMRNNTIKCILRTEHITDAPTFEGSRGQGVG